MKTTTDKSKQPSNTTIQIFKPELSKLLALTTDMIERGEIKTNIEFAKRFMFSFDSDEKFPINLEMLIEMKVYDRKDNLKKKLISHFSEEDDYKMIKAAPEFSGAAFIKGGAGKNKEQIFLTVDCFKTLCMLSNNEIGKLVKIYYIDLEKVFKTYVFQEYQQKQLELDRSNKENKRILKLHNQMTTKHNYYKFKKGPVFYIIDSEIRKLITDITKSKICSVCKILTSFDDYHKNKANKSGIESQCKFCSTKLKSGNTKIKLVKPSVIVSTGLKHCPKCNIIKKLDDFLQDENKTRRIPI